MPHLRRPHTPRTDSDTATTPRWATVTVALVAMLVGVLPQTVAGAQQTDSRGIDRVCPPPDQSRSNQFGDDDGSTHEAAIDCAAQYRVVAGADTDSYQPSGDVTRAQMATFIANLVETARGSQLPEGSDAFGDDDNSVHEAHINQLAAAGIVGGADGDRYEPAAAVSRAQMATFIASAVDHRDDGEVNGSLPPPTDEDAFVDDEDSSHEDNINRLAAQDIVVGTGPMRYEPGTSVTRAQMATFVMRAADYLQAQDLWAGQRPVTVETTVITTDLEAPWDVAFTSDGAYITERDSGRVLLRTSDGDIREVDHFDVDNSGEGGLLGLAPSPNYDEDGLLYVYYTAESDNRIVRFRPGGVRDNLVTGIAKASIHDAGRVAFGPDGKLYAATGDAGDGSRSQDPNSLNGKILRINPDGSVPADNPRDGSYVYASGLRDPQGLAWDADGRLFATEFGPDRDDEINHIVADGNYGWPQVTGNDGQGGFRDPIFVRQPPVASWSGTEIVVDGAVPEWEGDLFAAGLRGERLWHLELDGSRVVASESLLEDEYGRLRQVIQAPDDSLWILTSNRDGRGDPVAEDDRIIRVGPR